MFGFAGAALATGLVAGPTLALLVALGLLVAGGALDDMHDLPPRSKFVAQLVAALLMTYWAGVFAVQLGDLLGLGKLHLYHWAIPFSVVCARRRQRDQHGGRLGRGERRGARHALPRCAALQTRHAARCQPSPARSPVPRGTCCRRPGAARAMGDAGGMMLGFAVLSRSTSPGEGRTLRDPFVWILAVPLLDIGRVMFVRCCGAACWRLIASICITCSPRLVGQRDRLRPDGSALAGAPVSPRGVWGAGFAMFYAFLACSR
jgi:UDP-GlcNAc:undecaprenyl-phosphate GlcNAc-1-phosphate transferase